MLNPESPAVRRCAVLGSPITHSLSPVIHRAAYARLGLPWRYEAYDVAEDALAAFLGGLDDRWQGLSVTMPLKRRALELAADSTPLARTVGAANTLVRDVEGRWLADNTDVPGAVATLRESAADTAGDVCLWGGGATAASVLAALATLKSGQVHVHVRSVDRARPALAVAEALSRPAQPGPWAVGSACLAASTVVSTAPAGALDAMATELAHGAMGRVLFDVVYHPWPTAIAVEWERSGGAVASGLDLLVHQAAAQVVLMTGREVKVSVLRSAAAAALSARTSTR